MRTILLLTLVAFCSCLTMKHSPTGEYREAKPYHYCVQKLEKAKIDSIRVYPVLTAAAILNYNRLEKEIDLNTPELINQVTQSLQRHFESSLIHSDSVSVKVHVGNHAIDNNLRKKENPFSYSHQEKSTRNEKLKSVNSEKSEGVEPSKGHYSIYPYIELTVGRDPEYDGGGGISMAYPTGNMKYWITYGMIIEVQNNGRKMYARGYYYTEFKKVPEETEMTFDFPVQRLDSLLSLCLKDLPKEMFSK